MNKFTIIFLIGLLIGIIIRLSYQHFDNKKLVKMNYGNWKEYIVFIGIAIFAIIIPIIASYRYPNLDYNVLLWLKYVGILMIILALFLFYSSHKDLDKQFSPTLDIKQNHKLIDTGIYKYIRHPMYTSLILFIIAQALLVPNKLGVASTTMALIILLLFRIPEEEKMLNKEFEGKYKDYSDKTCGLIPYVCNFFKN